MTTAMVVGATHRYQSKYITTGQKAIPREGGRPAPGARQRQHRGRGRGVVRALLCAACVCRALRIWALAGEPGGCWLHGQRPAACARPYPSRAAVMYKPRGSSRLQVQPGAGSRPILMSPSVAAGQQVTSQLTSQLASQPAPMQS